MDYPMYATLRYEFCTASWVACLENDERVTGSGTTPEEAVENLKFQANKHGLWPKS